MTRSISTTVTFVLVASASLLLLAAEPSTQPTMSAIVIHEHGGPDVLKLEQIPRPSPGEGELLVRVHAAGVNPVDWRMRNAGFGGRGKLPYTPGFDISGVVEQVGANVTKFKSGDAIFAMLDLRRVTGGGYAEYAICREKEAALKPGKISYTDAAGIPLVALTAWQALFDAGKLEKGQSVLIHAGAGGVGSMAIQLAKSRGAKVYATASKDNLDFLKQLGADVAIDYRNQKFEDLAKDIDVVLDSIGGDTQDRSWQTLKKGGVLVSIVGRPNPAKNAAGKARGEGILVHVDQSELEQIAKLLDSGTIHPVETQVLPLAEAAKAQEISETHHARGKIVLKIIDE